MRKLKYGFLLLLIIVASVIVVDRMVEPESEIATSDVTADAFVVVLDAGHGGYDSGAIAVDGVYEKDINLDIVLMIGEQLEAEGIRVVYIREDDDVSFAEEDNVRDLRYRVAVAQQSNADLYVSLHCNSSEY